MKAGQPPHGVWPLLIITLAAVGTGCTLPPPQGSPGSSGGGVSQGSNQHTDIDEWISSYKGVADVYHYETRETQRDVPLTVAIAWTDVSEDRTHITLGGDEGRTTAWQLDVPVRENPASGSTKYRTIGEKEGRRYTFDFTLAGVTLTGTILVETLRANAGPTLYQKMTGTFYRH
jgi:hypothetical protein